MVTNNGTSGNVAAATKSDGTLWMWGSNSYGNLGQNALNPPSGTGVSSPVQVPGTTWSGASGKITTTSNHSAAIKTDGTLWMWGYGNRGVLAQNSNANYSSPAQVPGTTWNQISHDGSITIATKTDGTLWTWGTNYAGKLGQNETAGSPAFNAGAKSSPAQIPGTSWKWSAAGYDIMAATRTNGTLWVWGSNYYGSLGINSNTPTEYSSPIQVPGTTWDKVQCRGQAIGTSGMIASKTDGTLWAWGNNSAGVLGQNTDVGRHSSPVQITGTTWDEFCGVELNSAGALKTDGTIWSWGYNNNGQLGQNDRTSRSSPIQVGTDTNWTRVESAGKAMLGLKSVPSSS